MTWFMGNIRISQKYEYSRKSQQFFAAKCFGSGIKSCDQGDKEATVVYMFTRLNVEIKLYKTQENALNDRYCTYIYVSSSQWDVPLRNIKLSPNRPSSSSKFLQTII
jgi:hypothetical protein